MRVANDHDSDGRVGVPKLPLFVCSDGFWWISRTNRADSRNQPTASTFGCRSQSEAIAENGALTQAAFLVYLGLVNGIPPCVTSVFHTRTFWGPIVFRRRIGKKVWHSSPECFSWPTTDFEEKEHPTIGHRCSKCWAIEDAKARQPVKQAKPNDPK
jgi:hypothetical protein